MNADFNSLGFRVISCINLNPVPNVAAQFMYKGYEISLSTFSERPTIAIYKDDEFITDMGSVQDAIERVDTLAGEGIR